jgi:MarR family transcriptional regulator, organic hydroperoxide resistance regulator
MADLRGVFSDLEHVQVQLATAVDLRLRGQLGLPLVLFESMTVIAEVEGCRVQDLAAELGVSAGRASKLADRLTAVGCCRRLPNPDDRRSSLVQLTPTGRQWLTQARRAADEELERLLAPVLSTAQIRELAATLRELRWFGQRPSASRTARTSRPLVFPPALPGRGVLRQAAPEQVGLPADHANGGLVAAADPPRGVLVRVGGSLGE